MGQWVGAPWRPGCCMLRGCCGARRVQHDGAATPFPPREGLAVGGYSSGVAVVARLEHGGHSRVWKGQDKRWI